MKAVSVLVTLESRGVHEARATHGADVRALSCVGPNVTRQRRWLRERLLTHNAVVRPRVNQHNGTIQIQLLLLLVFPEICIIYF